MPRASVDADWPLWRPGGRSVETLGGVVRTRIGTPEGRPGGARGGWALILPANLQFRTQCEAKRRKNCSLFFSGDNYQSSSETSAKQIIKTKTKTNEKSRANNNHVRKLTPKKSQIQSVLALAHSPSLFGFCQKPEVLKPSSLSSCAAASSWWNLCSLWLAVSS